MRSWLNLILILCVIVPVALADWTGTIADQYISYDDNLMGWYTRMAVTSDGTIHVVWNEKVISYPTQQEIHYSQSSDNGVSWSAIGGDIIISYDDATNAENGSGIAVDSQDNLYVVWCEDDPTIQEVHYSISMDGGNTWSGQTGDQTLSLPGGNNAYNPDIAIDSDDVIHVVWNQVYEGGSVDEIHYSRSFDGGATWSSQTAETVISYPDGDASSYADIVIGPNDELYVMWRENDNTVTTHDALYLTTSTDGGDTWSGATAETPITQPIRIILYPQMEIDSNGYLHAVCKGTQDTVSTFHYEVFYTGSDDGGITWTGTSQDIIVSFDDGNSSNIPNLGCDSQGNVIVVWDENHQSDDNEIHLSVSTDGGVSWSGSTQDEIISFPDGRPAYRPFIVAGIDDMLHVTWNEGTTSNGYYQIHYSRGDAIGGGSDVTIDLNYTGGSPVPAGGGNIDFGVFVENVSASPVDYDAWLEISYEGGAPTTVALRSFTNYLPGWTINRPNMFFPVQGGYAAGNYTFTGKVGVHPDNAWDQSGFSFVKSGSDFITGFIPWAPDGVPNPFDEIQKGDARVAPTELVLLGAYPNPFNPTTAISYQLSVPSLTKLTVYDVNGRLVTELVNGWRDAGVHEVTFDGSNAASGIYLYELHVSGSGATPNTETGKMVLVK